MKRFFVLLSLGLSLVLFLATNTFAEEQKFGGVGLQVVPTITGELVVLNVLENTPASERGVLPGDLIFQVDDFPLQGSEFGVVVSEYLWGPVDSNVELFYRRPGVAGVSRVVLKRSSIDPRLTVTPTAQNGSAGKAEGQ
jgi:C-terminal processing protease CtpA/Prc